MAVSPIGGVMMVPIDRGARTQSEGSMEFARRLVQEGVAQQSGAAASGGSIYEQMRETRVMASGGNVGQAMEQFGMGQRISALA